MRGEVCIDGVLYFGAVLRRYSVIVCFDVRSEKFDFVDIDEDMFEEYKCFDDGYLALFNYKGKLGICHKRADFDRVVLWVLEDAASHKWSNIVYGLPTSVKEKRFVGMTATCEILLSYRYSLNIYRVYFYNLETKSFTTLDFQGFEEFKYHIPINTFVDYVENLKFL
ncbi:unnamed protein product [Microthlaspi erraticum]|uniref:F-box associated beta-propeller type 3 domain-containing protein n=1 Tax=Microthlaspi erraticum TaxID=1685480 RepID=A0A6D2JP81_9BRAS|nr:unnamed protein product [Microthlaspi erraticum]